MPSIVIIVCSLRLLNLVNIFEHQTLVPPTHGLLVHFCQYMTTDCHLCQETELIEFTIRNFTLSNVKCYDAQTTLY